MSNVPVWPHLLCWHLILSEWAASLSLGSWTTHAEGYITQLPRKEGFYNMAGVNTMAIQISQEELENTTSIYQTNQTSTSRFHRDDGPSNQKECCAVEALCLDRDGDETHGGNGITYVVNKLLLHAGSGPAFSMCCDDARRVRQTTPHNLPILYRNTSLMHTAGHSYIENIKGSPGSL